MPKISIHAFTSKYDRLSNVLINQVHIAPAFDESKIDTIDPDTLKEYDACWDTGATHSVITKKVVDECGLQPTGMTKVYSATEETDAQTYLVGIFLLNKVAFPHLKVSEGKLRGIDVLIGMDIIGQGDFAVNNKDGKTTFSYRVPSIECIDFSQQSPKSIPPGKVGRNSPCPCGSGKKYKKCHGK